jgi:hypothetical protein
MKRVIKHELIEVVVPAFSTATRFQLPDAQNLRNVQTWGIQAYYDNQVPISIISQRVVVNKKAFVYAFLTLENYSGREFDKQSPLSKFQTIENNMTATTSECSIQEKDFKSMIGQRINFPKSYVDVVFPVSKEVDSVFLLSVYYSDAGETFSQTTFNQKH